MIVGVAIGRRVRTASTFFVAGRRFGPVLVCVSVLAANIGAGSTMGAAELGYRYGLAAWWWVGSAGIGTLLLAFWVGPRVWRVAKEQDLQTAGDFLELRYGAVVRVIVMSLLWVGTLFILAAQLLAVSLTLYAVAGIPKFYGCLIGGVVIAVYFSSGGILSSAWVNLVQLVVLGTGFLLVLPVTLDSVGGWTTLAATASGIDSSFVDVWQSGAPLLRYAALLVPAFIVSPGLLQRIYAARDVRSVRIGVGVAGVALLCFAWVPAILGMVARVYFPDLEVAGLALPTLLIEKTPLLIGSLGLAAIFSAELSSADAILFMLTTSLSRDFFQRFLWPEMSDRNVLRVARVTALITGMLGMLIAIRFESIVEALGVFYAILTVIMFVPIIGALYCNRAGSLEALGAIGGGVSAFIAIHLMTGGSGYGVWSPTLSGLVLSAVVFLVVVILKRFKRVSVV